MDVPVTESFVSSCSLKAETNWNGLLNFSHFGRRKPFPFLHHLEQMVNSNRKGKSVFFSGAIEKTAQKALGLSMEVQLKVEVGQISTEFFLNRLQ